MTSPQDINASDFIISETYDLLQISDIVSTQNNKYMLKVPTTNNCKEIRFRNFKPIMKTSISNIQRQNVNIDIYPVIFSLSNTTDGLKVDNVTFPGYQLTNYANNYDIAFKDDSYTSELSGNIDQIVNNINEKIAGFSENFKPSGTFCFVSADRETRYTLSLNGNEAITIREYYDFFKDNTINPSSAFTTLNYKSDNPDLSDIEFYTSNLMFTLLDLTHKNNNIIILTFIVDIYSDIDIINVSTFRQLNNCIEYMLTKPSNMWCTPNECISTNTNIYDQLIFADYLINGIDLVLRSPDLPNQSNIVYVNNTEAQIYMKAFQTQSALNFFTVYLTDIRNNPIPMLYLSQLYSSIILNVDFVYAYTA